MMKMNLINLQIRHTRNALQGGYVFILSYLFVSAIECNYLNLFDIKWTSHYHIKIS